VTPDCTLVHETIALINILTGHNIGFFEKQPLASTTLPGYGGRSFFMAMPPPRRTAMATTKHTIAAHLSVLSDIFYLL
jgi:hypothetical protein